MITKAKVFTKVCALTLIILFMHVSVGIYAQRYVEIRHPSDAHVTSGTQDANPVNNTVDIIDRVFYPAKKARLVGLVFFDKNKNGIIENTETGLPNVTVIIETQTDGVYRLKTNEAGYYSIELYVGEEIRILYEILGDDGEVTRYIVTTEENGGSLKQTIVFDDEFVAFPVGLFYEDISDPEIEFPKPIEQVVKPVTVLVRTGQRNGNMIMLVLFIVMVLASSMSLVHHPMRYRR